MTVGALRSGLIRPEAQEPRAIRLEPGFGAFDMCRELGENFPECWRMVHVDEMRDLVRGEIIEHVARRHDEPPGEIEAPVEEHEPQRLVVSRKLILRGLTPSFPAWRLTAASMSRLASRMRKSFTRRATCGRLGADAKQRQPGIGHGPSTGSIQTLPRCRAARQCDG